MKLAVGFLTYNELTAKYLPEFWLSLNRALLYCQENSQTKIDYKILIADNSDKIDNLNKDFFSAHRNEPFEFNWNKGNLGFSKAYNLLIRRAKELAAEYFFIINPDTVLAEKSLFELLKALESDSNLASVSPKILAFGSNKIDTLGLVMKSGLRFADYGQGRVDSNEQPKILGPSGAAGLFRMSALEKVKILDQYFDERMFMYKEDCDLAYRLFLIGGQSRLVSSALIYHDRSAKVSEFGFLSILRSRQSKSRAVRAWSFANQNLLWRKYFNRQNLKNKIIIILLYLTSHIYALVFERFLLNNSKK